MSERRHKRLPPIAAVLLIAGFSIVYGQIHEYRLDPDEIGIRDIESVTIPDAQYVGNEVCMECHEPSYQKWLETQHARAFVPMWSMMAMKVAEMTGISTEMPAKSGKCLACHATAHDVPAEYRGPKFRMGEGVSCEKCHGPGGDHVTAVAEGKPSTSKLQMPTKKDCMVCHAPKPTHEMVCANCHGSREDHIETMMRGKHSAGFDKEASGNKVCLGCHRLRPSHMTFMRAAHYSYETALKKIAHSEERD